MSIRVPTEQTIKMFPELPPPTTRAFSAETSPPPNEIQSTGTLAPQLQISDRLRQSAIESQISKDRSSCTEIIDKMVAEPGHKIVAEDLINWTKNGDKQKYGQYLINVQHDISLIETALQKHNLPISSLSRLYCQEKIDKDLQHLAFKAEPSDLLKKYDHAGYYRSLSDKPHVLLGHFTMHVLGFLAGGRFLAANIKQTWGINAANLYDYSPEPSKLREQFKKELNAYMQTLPVEEFEEFQMDIEKNLWNYFLDLLDRDTRA